MSKEMNKIQLRTVKNNLIITLFLSLIIGISFSFVIAVVFAIGSFVSLVNYLLLIYFLKKNLLKGKIKVIISSLLRIIIVAAMIIPFAHNYKLVISYLLGFTLHYIVMIYCTITQKGSA